MSTITPLKAGAAFSITVSIGYTLCTLAFWAWPDAAVTFLNGLFHGLDFRALRSGLGIFDFGAVIWALAVLSAWAFMMGALFAGILREIAGSESIATSRRESEWASRPPNSSQR